MAGLLRCRATQPTAKAGCRCGREVQAGLRRPTPGDPRSPAARSDARCTGLLVPGGRSTITRAVAEIRPLLADRGCRVDSGLRLRTLADVIAHLGATGQTALMDATEIRVRRPSAHRGGRSRFVSGKSRNNAMKALVITNEQRAAAVLRRSPRRVGMRHHPGT